MYDEPIPVRTIVKSDNIAKKIEAATDEAEAAFLALVRQWFGDVGVRNLDEFHINSIRETLSTYAEKVIAPVEGHYIIQEVRQTEAATWNMFRGVLAGGIVEQRRHGEEPDPLLLAIATGNPTPEETR